MSGQISIMFAWKRCQLQKKSIRSLSFKRKAILFLLDVEAHFINLTSNILSPFSLPSSSFFLWFFFSIQKLVAVAIFTKNMHRLQKYSSIVSINGIKMELIVLHVSRCMNSINIVRLRMYTWHTMRLKRFMHNIFMEIKYFQWICKTSQPASPSVVHSSD